MLPIEHIFTSLFFFRILEEFFEEPVWSNWTQMHQMFCSLNEARQHANWSITVKHSCKLTQNSRKVREIKEVMEERIKDGWERKWGNSWTQGCACAGQAEEEMQWGGSVEGETGFCRAGHAYSSKIQNSQTQTSPRCVFNHPTLQNHLCTWYYELSNWHVFKVPRTIGGRTHFLACPNLEWLLE